ncbi:MAG: hypothetical protein FWF02_09380 [Micrococcales bacterium]|nr:hypothetical protein [Micrococcales bacterium]MCL2667901.1 hypothetical protein [Micrococcales bacterium]
MSVRPRWEWVLRDADGRTADRPAGPAFTTRFDAEQWIGEHWRSLAAADVASAQLVNEGEPVGSLLPLAAVD